MLGPQGEYSINWFTATTCNNLWFRLLLVKYPYQLTPREKEIFESLVEGNSYKMTASSLNISLETVKTHIKKVYEKLQVNSQIEAEPKAMKEKIV